MVRAPHRNALRTVAACIRTDGSNMPRSPEYEAADAYAASVIDGIRRDSARRNDDGEDDGPLGVLAFSARRVQLAVDALTEATEAHTEAVGMHTRSQTAAINRVASALEILVKRGEAVPHAA
jgi:hypothetical protein